MSDCSNVNKQTDLSDYQCEMEKDEGYQLFLDKVEDESERKRQSETVESGREDRS